MSRLMPSGAQAGSQSGDGPRPTQSLVVPHGTPEHTVSKLQYEQPFGCVGVGVWVGGRVGVKEGVGVLVAVRVAVGGGVAVEVAVAVRVGVRLGSGVGVKEGVAVAVRVRVAVGVRDAVCVGLAVAVRVRVGAGVHFPPGALTIDCTSACDSGTLKISSSLITISPWIGNMNGYNRVPPIQKSVPLPLSVPTIGVKPPTAAPFR